MQRAAWLRSSESGYGRYTSRQSRRRSVTGRYGCFWRWISMNPVALPMHDLEIRQHDRYDIDGAELRLAFEHAPVIPRHHFHEHLRRRRPVGQQAGRERAARVPHVPLQQLEHQLHVVFTIERFEIHELGIAAWSERRLRIVDVRDTAAHAGCEIASGLAEHDDTAAGHVLAAMIADAFDDGDGSAVADRETFAG